MTKRNGKELTDKALQNLRATGQRYTVPDTREPGLSLRVGASGRMTWAVQYRQGSRVTRVTLGTYPELSLVRARKAALEHRSKVQRGEIQSPSLAPSAPTVGALVEGHLATVPGSATPERLAAATLHLAPIWSLPATELTGPKIVTDVLDPLHVHAHTYNGEWNGNAQANRMVSILRCAFRWALERGMVDRDPTERLRRKPTVRRERYYSPDEIKTLWTGTQVMSPWHRLTFRLLLATGLRRSEVVQARWEEINLTSAEWIIPAERTKAHRAHRVPLSTLTLDLLRQARTEAGTAPWVICQRCRGLLKPILPDSVSVAWYRATPTWGIENGHVHDLRRTAATAMAELGVRREVISAILDHTDSGVTSIYVRASLMEQQREALQRWADYLLALVSA